MADAQAFWLGQNPTRLKIGQETSINLMTKILKANFVKMVDAQTFWLRREAHTPKSGNRDK